MKEFIKRNLFLVSIIVFLIFSMLSAFTGYKISLQTYASKNSEKAIYSELPWSMKPTDQYNAIFSSEVPGQFEAYSGESSALIDATGKILKEHIDEENLNLGEGLYLFEEKDLYGVKDSNGLVIIEARYKQISKFQQGYTSAWNGIHYELLDRHGQKILTDQPITNIVHIENTNFFIHAGRSYILNAAAGKEVPLPSKVIGITTDENGRYLAKLRDDAYCYLSDSFAIPKGAILYSARPEFSEGLAYVERYDDLIVDEKLDVPLTEGHTRLRGYMNESQEMILPLSYQDIQKACPFSEGKALIYADKKIVCIDKNGEALFTLKDQNRSDRQESVFLGGHAALSLDGIKDGIIDSNGKFVIEPIFDSVGRINGGYVAVRYKNKVGILNLTQL